MSNPILNHDQLNDTYKSRAPRLPSTVDNAQTDLLMASLVMSITMKVTHNRAAKYWGNLVF